jgi:hypothetical protein
MRSNKVAARDLADIQAGQEWFWGRSSLARIEKTTPCTAVVSVWQPFGSPDEAYTQRFWRRTLERWLVEPVPGGLPTLREAVSRLDLLAHRCPTGEVQVFSQHPVLVRLQDYEVQRVTPGGSVILSHKDTTDWQI